MKIFKKLTLLIALGTFFMQTQSMHKAAAVLTKSMKAKPALMVMGAFLAQNTARAEEGKYAPPADVKALLEEHKAKILALPCGSVSCSIAPGFCVKDRGPCRVEGAALIQKFIDKHGITTLAVPKKYKHTVGDRELVLAEIIDVKPVESINLQEMKDLIFFVETTGYLDLHTQNLMRDAKTGKLVILDTEAKSFVSNNQLDHFIPFRREFGLKLTIEALVYFKEYNKKNCERIYGKSLPKSAQCFELGGIW